MADMKMPLPTRKRALELGAAYIEQNLHDMRNRARKQYEHATATSRKPCPRGCTPGNAVDPASEGVPSPCRTCRGEAFVSGWDGRERPLTSSLENDLMTVAEWATCAAMLRAMAADE